MTPDELYKKAVEKWGVNAQINMLVEEMAELTKAICKLSREDRPAFNSMRKNSIEEEIADVEIMLGQMRIIFDSSNIDGYKNKKLQRLNNLVRG